MNPANTPEQNAESARRLNLLADFLEKLSPARFDYGRWVGDSWAGKQDLSCGTTACALGWAAAIPEFQALGLELATVGGFGFVRLTGEERAPSSASSDAGSAVFFLGEDEFEFLFLPLPACDASDDGEPCEFEDCESCGSDHPLDDATAADVASHIRAFVAKHRAPVTP